MMKFHLGAIPASEDFIVSNDWKPLREPGPILMQCYALPLGVLFCALMVWLWLRMTPITRNPDASPLLLLIVMLSIIPVHELLHSIMHPKFGLTEKSILGFWASRMIFYAHYTGELSRNRFIAILGMPLLIISILPLVVCSMIGRAPVTVAFASCFNALAAGGDIFAILISLFQVPTGATVRNQGWRTYWCFRL